MNKTINTDGSIVYTKNDGSPAKAPGRPAGNGETNSVPKTKKTTSVYDLMVKVVETAFTTWVDQMDDVSVKFKLNAYLGGAITQVIKERDALRNAEIGKNVAAALAAGNLTALTPEQIEAIQALLANG